MPVCLQVKKLQDRVAKAKDEVQKTKEKYEQSLREINEYNPKYMEDMTTVFEKCQEFEEKRLKFFKEMLFSIHSCLNISNMPEVVRIYEEYRHTIQSADASKDLKYWSNTHGVGMAMNWPIFEVRIQSTFCRCYDFTSGRFLLIRLVLCFAFCKRQCRKIPWIDSVSLDTGA